jgi:hypothetical protein
MKRPRQTRRALLVALCLIPVIAVAAWQIIPPGRDQFATVQVTRADIESSVTALGTCNLDAMSTSVPRRPGRSTRSTWKSAMW